LASFFGHLKIVKFLVESGANIQATTKGGETPLDLAYERGQSEIVKFLEDKEAQRSSPLSKFFPKVFK
jgi:ankyrin repeat protein